MRWPARVPLLLGALLMLGLLGCGGGPAGIGNCSVRKTPNGAYFAAVTRHNYSPVTIVKSAVLVDPSHLGPSGGNRLFDTSAPVGPGQTRNLVGVEDGSARLGA